MRRNVILIIGSLLSILLMTIHMTDDIVRGMEPGTLFDLIIVPILAVWLYATLLLIDRRSGLVIILIEFADRTGRSDHPHEGRRGRRRDREVRRGLPLRLDLVCARGDGAFLRDAGGARVVGPSAAIGCVMPAMGRKLSRQVSVESRQFPRVRSDSGCGE